MKSLRILTQMCLVGLLASATTLGDKPFQKEPSHACDIVFFFGRFTIPRINYNASLQEVLDFICRSYQRVSIDPPLTINYSVDYKLPETMLRKQISLHAENVTIAQALKMALKDIDVVITFETGKVIFTEKPRK